MPSAIRQHVTYVIVLIHSFGHMRLQSVVNLSHIAPKREMVAPPQHVALTRDIVHAPAVATVRRTGRQRDG